MVTTSSFGIGLTALSVALASCGGSARSDEPPAPDSLIATLTLPGHQVLATIRGVEIGLEGYGSGGALDPGDPGRLYVLTDRGPNFDAGPATKAFPQPEFVPRVQVFRLRRDSTARLELERTIMLRDAGDRPLSGLPNPPGPGATGERPVTAEGQPLVPDPLGLDPEGIHVLADHSFWVSDEYGPFLTHFDSTGRTLERLSPFGGERRLPLVLARRRVNRGLEGLTGNAAGTVLIGVMQGPLDNPKAAGRSSRVARLLAFEPATGRTRQYLYTLESPGSSASGLAWIDGATLLVLEHDGDYPGGTPPATIKRIYQVSLAGATDVSDPADDSAGRRVDGRTFEEATLEELGEAEIVPVTKRLVADLLRLGYPHDKPEGLVFLAPDLAGVLNDDDFGITEGPGGAPIAKRLPAAGGAVDRNELWLVRLRPRATDPRP